VVDNPKHHANLYPSPTIQQGNSVMKKNYRFIYLRDDYHLDMGRDFNMVGCKGNPVGCLVVSLASKDNNTYTVEYAVSSLNPGDDFDRKMARELAVGRLVSSPFRATFCLSDRPYSIHACVEAVMDDVAANESLSGRVRKSARKWVRAYCC
jgi:hypothetical protein